jgi:hypothetical protein
MVGAFSYTQSNPEDGGSESFEVHAAFDPACPERGLVFAQGCGADVKDHCAP